MSLFPADLCDQAIPNRAARCNHLIPALYWRFAPMSRRSWAWILGALLGVTPAMKPRLLAIVFALSFASFTQAQVPPEKALATFTVTDPELELSLWASEPLFVNPTCFDIDHKNRVWVC